MTNAGEGTPSPYVELGREAWRALREGRPLPLTSDELEALRGLSDPIDLGEVTDVYLPLSRLINLFVAADARLRDTVGTFLPSRWPRRRSSSASPAASRSASRPSPGCCATSSPPARRRPNVELVTTDGFLYPNAVLAERGLMQRKGFPESYDRRSLLRFVSEIKAGVAEASMPVYNPLIYDIVPGARQVVRRPDILIVEGLNVLQSAKPGGLAVTDLFDFSIYVDARVNDIRRVVRRPVLRAAPHDLHRRALLLPPVRRGRRG